jgi:hypothetical protein
MNSTNPELPAEVVECINNWIVTFALAYHRRKDKDISNDAAEFITDELSMPNALTSYAIKLQAAEREVAEMKRWKAEAIRLLSKIDDYADDHPGIKLGMNKVDFTIDRAMSFDKTKEQATGWRPLLEAVLNDWNSSVLKSELKDKIRKFLYGE